MNKVTDENARDHLDEDFTVPTTVNSGWTKRLKNLVQNAGVDRGNVEIVCSDNESLNNESKSNDTKRNKQIMTNEALFKKLRNNPSARSNLSVIHSARSHKYGHVQFGPKSWYKECENVSEKLTSQEDRRKFRQGLKCNVEFLNQLNLHDLTKTLVNGEQKIDSLHKSVHAKLGDIFECLKDVPIIEVLQLIDKKKAQKICLSLDKISALAHLSQSMGNYFARDDSLDPALSIVCQALRGNIDIEYILRKRGGTFQSLASSYHHLKSPKDRDLSGNTHNPKPQGSGGGYSRGNRRKTTFCWYFQRNGRCSKSGCTFKHKCKRCGSKNHGEKNCRSRGDSD